MLKRFARNVARILTLNCEESCRLQSRILDEEHLGAVDRLAHLGHGVSCGTCRRIHRQFKVLERAIRGLHEHIATPLPAKARQRIISEINQLDASGSGPENSQQ